MRHPFALLLILLSPLAGGGPANPPQVSILIDDIGYTHEGSERALALPGEIAYAVLPMTPYGREAGQRAQEAGREILLHLPMDPMVGDHALGPGAVTLDMTRSEFRRTVLADLADLPPVVGINNHMGSLLTQHPGAMRWLMELMGEQGGLFFIDSRTSVRTVALRVAEEWRIPAIKRDVFLDDTQDPQEIERQFDRLLQLARNNGAALAIGHPHPATLEILERRLPGLGAQGFRLVRPSALVARAQRRTPQWQASLSPLPKAAKKSKP